MKYYSAIQAHKESEQGQRDLFVRYTDLVRRDKKVVQELERYLGYPVSWGDHPNPSHDFGSPFYSEHYGKAVTPARIGAFRTILTRWETARVEKNYAAVLVLSAAQAQKADHGAAIAPGVGLGKARRADRRFPGVLLQYNQ
jgi:hypothetical protein